MSLEELADRAQKLVADGGYAVPDSQTPWQALFREKVGRFDEGMTLDGATSYQDIARIHLPRDNH